MKKITHERGNPDAWICLCKNTPDSHGFYPSDINGEKLEPTIGSNWDGLYVCDSCGLVIDQDSLEIFGKATPAIMRLNAEFGTF